MFFQLNELLRWLGLTAFEIFTALVCFIVFTVLVTLKVRRLLNRADRKSQVRQCWFFFS